MLYHRPARGGLRIHEVPVDWTDDTDSRVNILATVLADVRGTARVRSESGSGRIGIHVEVTAPPHEKVLLNTVPLKDTALLDTVPPDTAPLESTEETVS